MTATPNFASGAGAEAGSSAAPALNAGPFVLNLCSSTTPMALAQTDLPELRRFTFFVSRRFEEGRERFRLHMGYFATLAEAEEWLGVVREIYPGAWAGETPGRKLRERAAAAAAAQAQHAAGPQTRIPAAAAARTPATPVVAPPPTPARARVTPPAPARVPIVHAAPPLVAPPPTRPAARQAPASAKAAASSPAALPATSARPAPVARPIPPSARPAAKASAAAPAVRAGAALTPAPRAPAAQRTPPAAMSRATTATAAPAAAPAARAAAAAPPVSAAAPPPARPAVKPVFEDSNVREVLKALGDASATGETRLMRAPPPPRESAPANPSLSDTQVLKLLETRRSEQGSAGPAEVDDSGIPLLKPDDTGTRQALKEAIVTNTAVSFAVQLQWSVQPVELDKVPPLAIFSAYTLYTVEGSRDGRKWYGLRLGFFSDAISAKQVAYYVRSEFVSVAVVPVSPHERTRATEQDAAAALAAPVPARSDQMDEFKLIDDDSPRVPTAPVAPASPSAAPARLAAAAAAKLPPKVAVGRALAPPGAPVKPRGRNPRVAARDNRGPQTLEETLEILGASQLTIDDGRAATINDSGVRHLRVEVQKNSPFSKLLERLSERLKKP
jgi:hypothetical protein